MPLRLAQGEMLYSDVRHIYGPLSPYINAALYTLFGPSLTVLYVEGILSALITLGLVYWLSRQLMERLPATAATLSVMWLCAFKQAGNYVLPYTYSALHGCALGLAALALIIKAVNGAQKHRGDKQHPDKTIDSERIIEGRDLSRPARESAWRALPVAPYYFLAAGAVAGIALLAKTEMGLAAIIAGMAAAALAGYNNLRRVVVLEAIFIAPAAALVAAVYGYIAAQVGWDTLSRDSFLFLQNIPPELVYFNKRMSGFDEPLQSLLQMMGALARVASLAIAIGVTSLLLTRRKAERLDPAVSPAKRALTDAGQTNYVQLWMLLALSALLFISIPVAGKIGWDKGPYLAMPILLAGLLLGTLIRYFKQNLRPGDLNKQTLVVIVIAVYALVSLARVLLRVRSGGAYSSYLLPASVILFTYGWVHLFADWFRDAKTRQLARNIALALIIIDVIATAGVLTYRYRSRNTHSVVTPKGTIVAVPDLGHAFDEAISYINAETAPNDPIAVMPEGTSLNFFTGRPNPLREEITTPGYLDEQAEERAIKQMKDSNTRLVLVTNRATPEFGPAVFGRDYCKRLMQWVEENFEQVAIFGPNHDPDLQIGVKTFFIRAYKRKA